MIIESGKLSFEISKAQDFYEWLNIRDEQIRADERRKIAGWLEKQIKMKPYMESDGDADGHPVWDYYCPTCNYAFEEEQPNYCPECGQRIDWTDELEEEDHEEEPEHRCKCGSSGMFTEQNGPHIGLYCKKCGKWQKWLNNQEARAWKYREGKR